MRVVLDTNVVLDLVVFADGGTAALRTAIDAGTVTSLACPAGLEELRRVLAYPAFKLDPPEREAAFAWYASRVERIDTPPAQPHLPRCRDGDDQKFLELAWVARASHLVTKDKALLSLARRIARLGRFTVTAPSALTLPAAGAMAERERSAS